MSIPKTGDKLRDLFVAQYVLFSNNPFYDKDFYNYIFNTDNSKKKIGTFENLKIQKKYIDCDQHTFDMMNELFLQKYNISIHNVIPIIIKMSQECIQKIIFIIKSDTSDKFNSEKIMIKLLDSGKYNNDMCPICSQPENIRNYYSQIVFECSHSICHNCLIKYNYNTQCPICRHISKTIITPMGLVFGNHNELLKLLISDANTAFDIICELMKHE